MEVGAAVDAEVVDVEEVVVLDAAGAGVVDVEGAVEVVAAEAAEEVDMSILHIVYEAYATS